MHNPGWWGFSVVELSRDTQELLDRVGRGEKTALEDLFTRHRDRLRRVVALRMDKRLASRVDSSDIVQETYVEAARRFEDYLQQPDMSFYLWLRWIAREKVIQEYRRHLGAEKRAIDREIAIPLSETSAEFAKEILGRERTPTQQLRSSELAGSLQEALAELDEDDGKVIIWRHFEELSVGETAELFGISKAAAAKRYLRALQKLRRQLVKRNITQPE